MRQLPVFLNFDLCESEICYKDAENLLSFLNTSVDPCDDFYEFVCGNWKVRNKRPESQPTWSQWEVLDEKVQKSIKNILDYNNFEMDNVPLQAAKILYKTCMTYDKTQDKNALELKQLLDKYGGWPILTETWNPDIVWFESISKINADLNVYPLVKFHVSTNLYDTTKHVLYIDVPSLIYPEWILLDPISYKIQIENYVDWIVNNTLELASINSINVSLSKIKEQSRDIVDFEIKLAKLVSYEEHQNLTNLFKKITMKKLQKLTDLLQLQHYYNVVPWYTVFETILANNSLDIQKFDQIIVRNLVYILKLIKLIDNTPARVVANYIGWNVVQYFAKETTVNLGNFLFEIEKSLSGIHELETREKHCISRIKKEMSLTINYEYIQNYFPSEVKTDITSMLDNIKRVLESKLQSLNWLDETTKKIAVEKANLLAYLIGYPENLKNLTYILEYYKDLEMYNNNVKNIIAWNKFIRRKEFSKLSTSTDNDRWFTITTDINAYYSILQNLIIVPAGILQYPFYKKDRLNALNYGAFGTILAHEFSHAFDNTGRQVDMHGNLKQWWTQESLENYEKNIQCIEAQYNKHIKNLLRGTGRKDVSSHRSQDENIADLIGLDIAYKAYIQSRDGVSDTGLPGMEEYSLEQLFFISYANIWCESSSSEQFLTQIFDGTHTPNKIRILGTLSQNKDFSRVFHCALNTPMNPKHKCVL